MEGRSGAGDRVQPVTSAECLTRHLNQSGFSMVRAASTLAPSLFLRLETRLIPGLNISGCCLNPGFRPFGFLASLSHVPATHSRLNCALIKPQTAGRICHSRSPNSFIVIIVSPSSFLGETDTERRRE